MFFFFFKQKTAYEMLRSLVGSEMCIRDRVYASNQKLVIDVETIVVEQKHLVQALHKVQPAAHRMQTNSIGRPLPLQTACCLQDGLNSSLELLSRRFNFLNAAARKSIGVMARRPTDLEPDWPGSVQSIKVYRPRLLLQGPSGCGHDQLAPAILHALESCQVFSIDLSTLFGDGGSKMLEETIVKQVREARRATPSVLFMPHADRWWKCMGESIQVTLCCELQDIPPHEQVLLLATSEAPVNELHTELQKIFHSPNHVHHITPPTLKAKTSFWRQFAALVNRVPQRIVKPAELPRLPVCSKSPQAKAASPFEAARHAREAEQVQRELRIVLRDLLGKLSKDMRFRAFCRQEVAEGAEKQLMDFQTMLERLDDGGYPTVKLFLGDIQQINSECRNYCKKQDLDTKPSLRRSMHRANELVDHAQWLIEENVDLHLQTRADEFAQDGPAAQATFPQRNRLEPRRNSGRLRGISVPDEVFFGDPDQMARQQKEREVEITEEQSPLAAEFRSPNGERMGQEPARGEDEEGHHQQPDQQPPEEEEEEAVLCTEENLESLVQILVKKTADSNLEQLMELHHELKAQLDTEHLYERNRAAVAKLMMQLLCG
eukprot:TRINITY_DN27487_c0_g2_i1.p1 TRINITY_DN27487_c0_g2~~TRINITY_DN27487_c0_g2_i1.p1  ORF type:complete len:603 (-),score=154.09 TRINITY_DN27487_c0_g2_i1:289-2097(-)